MNILLSPERTIALVKYLNNAGYESIYDEEKLRFEFIKNVHRLFVRIPLNVEAGSLSVKNINYMILLIQSGSCALGLYKNGENINHKVFTAYMVRMKQGKSQIKHLKTKGKSRAGSRVRLAESLEFFENINTRLKEYFEEMNIDLIAMSCSKILIPYLYGSKIKTPFEKNDSRIFKVPMHVNTPRYEVLQEVERFLNKGEIIFEEEDENLVKEILQIIT